MEHGIIRVVCIDDYKNYLRLREDEPMLEHHLRTARIIQQVLDAKPEMTDEEISRVYAEILDVCSNEDDWLFDYAMNFIEIYF
jgi:hypothetical protein